MSRSGKYVHNLEGEMTYQSFQPAALPPNPGVAIDNEMQKLLIDTNRTLAQLDEATKHISGVDLFISMYVRKEALMTSQIEGTQCTLDDVLNPNSDLNANINVADVVNYVHAANFALEHLKDLPLCSRLLKETHAVLMQGVRGADKEPGEFRHTQNWIGPAGCTLSEARFVPPNIEDMHSALSDLDHYMNESSDYDSLIQAGLIHYQFETIHPFLDGNGRVGRLLILLYLLEKEVLHKPVIYVSYFLKKNQIEYYDRISEVRRTGNYEQWLKFFLEALRAAANDALATTNLLSSLRERNLMKLSQLKRAGTIYKVFSYIEEHPILTIGVAAENLDISYNTASTAILKLADMGILEEKTKAARNRVFAYTEYLNILRPGT